MIRIHTVLGARPQFIKAAALSREFSKNSDLFSETIIHSGQHFDSNMSGIFFKQLGLAQPQHQLSLQSSPGHGSMTGAMMASLERVFQSETPDLVLVYGDTNTTLAAALAAVKMQIPVVHVEAGLRSRNNNMPEEINRLIVDKISAINFAPSSVSFSNLEAEGLGNTAHIVGDIMRDVVEIFAGEAVLSPHVVASLPSGVLDRPYIYATCHRGETTDDPKQLLELVHGLNLISSEIPIIMPVHPRLASALEKFSLRSALYKDVHLTDPVDFFSSLYLQKHAEVVLTDSGGIQKEAFYLETPCVTFRRETEWIETLELGWNRLSLIEANEIFRHVNKARHSHGVAGAPYGVGSTSGKILEILNNLDWKDYFRKS